ncbi:endonuclease domain-containing protein [Afipia sp. TerB]
MRQRVPTAERTFAKALRTQSTDAEMKLWRLLRDRRLSGAKFRRQVPIGTWVIDFVSFEHHLVFEADGGQHNESNHDKRRDVDLRTRGFRVLRFWNNDILTQPHAVLEAVAEAIGLSSSPGFAPDGAPPPSPTRGEGRKPAPRAHARDA